MHDLRFVTGHIAQQFEATFEMLQATVERCPDTVWEDWGAKPAFWHEAYHALFWCDNFVGNKDKKFEFRPVGVDIDPRLFQNPGVEVTKEKMLKLYAIAKGHVAQRLAEMTDTDLAERDGFGEDPSKPEFDVVLHRILYALRHGQHHVGKLAGRLGASDGSLETWRG